MLNDLYPTTRGGVTFGWDIAGSGTVALNRTTGNDKYAGINCQLNNGTQRTFRIDLPAAGRYQLRMSVGDYNFAHKQIYVRVSDGSTSLFTIDSTTNPDWLVASSSAVDAQGLHNYGLSFWEEYNAPREITMAGTALNITIGSPSAGLDYTCLTHVELVALDLVQSLTAQTPEIRVAGLYVEALTAALSLGTRFAGDIPASITGSAELDSGTSLVAVGRIEAAPRGRLAGAGATPSAGNFFLLF